MRRVALLLLLVLCAAGMHAETIRLDQYLAALERIDALLAVNQLDAARSDARTLRPFDVDSPAGRFHADESLLAAIAEPRSSVPHLRARIALTLAELRRATGAEMTAADRKLLEQVTAEQAAEELAEGGEIATVADDLPFFERIVESLSKILRWISDKILELLEWLIDLFPKSSRGDGSMSVRWIVFLVVVLIVLTIAILAIEVTRRSKRAAKTATQTSAPIGSRQDEDPLSRGATEWERYAEQLAADGRYREAIRAWYHAVLVTCYAEGVLHFRKGRTNWEYIASLPSSVSWRPELIRLTQRFEREWYGHNQSSLDALEECGTRAQRILDALRRKGVAA